VSAEPRAVRYRTRLIAACAGALWGGGLAWAFMRRDGYLPDFLSFWLAARQLLSGIDPYTVAAAGPPYFIREPFYYPLSTALALTPLAAVPALPAGAIFVALSSGLLAFAVSKDGVVRLPLFLSLPFVMAAALGQWAPLLIAGALLPGAGWTAVLKPNIGLALVTARPTRAALVGGVALLLLSLVIMPAWPIEWVRNARALPGHAPPVLSLTGALLVLALFRWRRPEGRLLFALGCVPQLPLFADQLPLFLVPATLRQSLVLALSSAVAGALWLSRLQPGMHPSEAAAPLIVPLLYLPCLYMVLRRSNEGTVREWLAAFVGGRREPLSAESGPPGR